MAQDQTPDPDALYQTYDRNLYKMTGSETEDDIMQMMQADPSANNSENVQVSASDMGSGVDTSTTVSATGSYQSGKKTFTNTDPGFILGVDPNVGLAKFYIGNSTKYINWDGSTLTVVGGVSISSLDIPDTTTANSFHVDASGNAWWGSNIATGINGAKAYIKDDGSAFFKNIQVGGNTYQYTMNDQGIYTFGDGSDGPVTFDGLTDYNTFSSHSGANYTLTRDVYATTLIVQNNVFLYPNGYRIFCQNQFNLQGGGQLVADGSDGAQGSGVVGGLGGAGGTAAGYFAAAKSGGNGAGGSTTGGAGGGTAGSSPANGTAYANSLSTLGATSATGGRCGSGGAANASTGGGTALGASAAATTFRNIPPILLWHFMTFFDINADGTLSKYTGTPGGGGGAGGGSGAEAAASVGGIGGAGGGAGGAGGMVWIAARFMNIASSSNILARGGHGAAGTNGADGTGAVAGGGGGGGGGAGGNGGIVFLIYNTLTNNGTITYTGGSGGTFGVGGGHTGGSSGGDGGQGLAGSAGSTGTLFQVNMAL